MRRAALVIAGNEYLAERARRAGAPGVERLPTAVDLNRYALVNAAETDFFTVGWIGTPITSIFLEDVAPVVRELGETRLLALGASNRPDVDVRPGRKTTPKPMRSPASPDCQHRLRSVPVSDSARRRT